MVCKNIYIFWTSADIERDGDNPVFPLNKKNRKKNLHFGVHSTPFLQLEMVSVQVLGVSSKYQNAKGESNPLRLLVQAT